MPLDDVFTIENATRVDATAKLLRVGDPVRVMRGVYAKRVGVIESFTADTVQDWAIVKFKGETATRDLVRCERIERIDHE